MALLNQFLDNPAFNFTKGDNPRTLKDLQANILRHHGKKHALHIFVEFNSIPPTREQIAWLKALGLSNAFDQLHDHIFDLEHNPKSTKILISAYLTYEGFQWLEIEASRIPGSDNDAFRQGPRWRTNFKKELDPAFKKNIHLMILMAGDDKAALQEKYQGLFKNFRTAKEAAPKLPEEEKGALGSCVVQWGFKSENDPLGYKDGISNPIFFPSLEKYPADKARRIDNPGLVLVPDVNGGSGYSLGSFLSFLKFEIDAEAFEKQKKKITDSLLESKIELAGAMMVGRFKNGTPVTLTDNEKMEGLEYVNYFDYTEWMPDETGRYKDDLDGIRCPHFAHIRKANPRDPQNYHRRIVRRGVNYEEGTAKGLLFQSFQSNIKEQFEYIVKNWLHTYGDGDAPDPLTFNHERYKKENEAESKVAFPKKWNGDLQRKKTVEFDKTFVTMKAGWYFFAPSISFFKMLKSKEPREVPKPKSTSRDIEIKSGGKSKVYPIKPIVVKTKPK